MFKHLLNLCRLTLSAWIDDKAPRLGASLAFYSILSLGPLLLLLVQVGSAILGREVAEGQIVGQIEYLVGQQGLEAVDSILRAAANRHEASLLATILTFGVLLFGASGVFGELQDALNIIWKSPPRPGKPILIYLQEKLFAFLMVGCAGLLLFASLAVSTLLNAFVQLASEIISLDMTQYLHRLDLIISFAMSTLLFALIFKVVPDKKILWSRLWPGAAFTAALFVAGKYLIGFYLTQSGMATVFGAAGSVVILLVWVYYTAQIIFFGAEFAHAVDQHGLLPPSGKQENEERREPRA